MKLEIHTRMQNFPDGQPLLKCYYNVNM